MATRAVATTAAGEHHDDKQQDQDEGDDPKYFHPAWRAGGRFAVGPHPGVVAGVAVGVGVGGVSYVRVLLCRASSFLIKRVSAPSRAQTASEQSAGNGQ